MFELAAGETDLVAARIDKKPVDPVELYAAKKRRIMTSRMIASQAVRPGWSHQLPNDVIF